MGDVWQPSLSFAGSLANQPLSQNILAESQDMGHPLAKGLVDDGMLQVTLWALS